MKKKLIRLIVMIMALVMTISLTGCSIPVVSRLAETVSSKLKGDDPDDDDSDDDTDEDDSDDDTDVDEDEDEDDSSDDEDGSDDDDSSKSGNKSVTKDDSDKSAMFGNSRKKSDEATWQELYLEEIENDDERDGAYVYNLIYVDDDDIPELVIDTMVEASGCRIYTYKDGEIDELQTGRLNFTYIERENLLNNCDGHMGYYYDFIYSIEDGKWTEVFSGEYESLGNDSNMDYDDETGRYITDHYYVDGEETDEAGYMKALKKVYDLDKARDPSPSYLYDDIVSYLSTGDFLSANHSYELFVDDCSWTEAERKCEDKGGYLACLTTDEEYEKVEDLIRKEELTNIAFYVGARYKDYNWQWIEPGLTQNNAVTSGNYDHWLNSGPSYTDKLPDGREVKEEYVEFFYRKSDDRFYLNDVVEDVVAFYPSFKGRMGYICEYPD
ncbi:MAG: C-type lectin domain-containing protein [Lachnospiraceae bacterium]|nr:C-type lectin domain-containing protein [Lachnospiraceae bacterium]